MQWSEREACFEVISAAGQRHCCIGGLQLLALQQYSAVIVKQKCPKNVNIAKIALDLSLPKMVQTFLVIHDSWERESLNTWFLSVWYHNKSGRPVHFTPFYSPPDSLVYKEGEPSHHAAITSQHTQSNNNNVIMISSLQNQRRARLTERRTRGVSPWRTRGVSSVDCYSPLCSPRPPIFPSQAWSGAATPTLWHSGRR